MLCPLTKEECPEHNKKMGCAWWLEVKEGEEAISTMKGCALVLQPMLLAEQINMTALVAKESNAVSSEISALRCENSIEHEEDRRHLLNLVQANAKEIGS